MAPLYQEFQFQLGSIKVSLRRGVPRFAPVQVGFNSQLGSIKAVRLPLPQTQWRQSFNSSLVLLKDIFVAMEADENALFQFQLGSIKVGQRSVGREKTSLVSIPAWFY